MYSDFFNISSENKVFPFEMNKLMSFGIEWDNSLKGKPCNIFLGWICSYDRSLLLEYIIVFIIVIFTESY